MPIAREDITGLLLAGGEGRRMDGRDKGLQLLRGHSLASRVLERLSPQVGRSMISANRNLSDYRALGVPVFGDEAPLAGRGPLSGFLTGLRRCETSCLLTVACDTPFFPADLARRLAQALAADPTLEMAMAATPGATSSSAPQRQPTFCLMRSSPALQSSLSDFLHAGERKIGLWATQQRCALVVFEHEAEFTNINTAADLSRFQ